MKGRSSQWRLAVVAIAGIALAFGGSVGSRSVAHAAVTCPGSQCVTVSDTATHAAWSGEGNFAGGANQTGAGSCFDAGNHPKATSLNGTGACEVDLLKVNVAATFWNTHSGGVELRLFDNATDDFDVFVWPCVGTCTNATNGAKGGTKPVAQGTASNGNGTPVNSLPEEDFTLFKPSGAYYIEVIPFATTAAYNMTADFKAAVPQGPPPPPAPGCVAGSDCLRDVRASQDQIDTMGTLYGATNPSPPPAKLPFEPDTQIEPSIAVNPNNPLNVVASFQQGRADAGASSGTGWATTTDGGQTWHTGNVAGLTKYDIAPCGRPAGESCAGPWDRASDPVVAFGPNNVVYQNSLLIKGDPDTTGTTDAALSLNESLDGGLTWSKPVFLHLSSTVTSIDFPALGHVFDDKNWITVDTGTGATHHPGRVYAVWDIVNVNLYAYCDPVNPLNSGDCMNPANWTTAGIPNTASANQGFFSEYPGRGIGAIPAVLNDGSLMVVLNDFQLHAEVEVTAPGAGAVPWPSALTFNAAPVCLSAGGVSTGAAACMNSVHSSIVPEQRAGPTFPQVAVDQSSGQTGKVYVAWADTNFRSDGVNDAVFTSSDATTSQTWGPVTRINNGSTNDHLDSWNTMIGISPDGTLRAAYRQRDETGAPPYTSFIFTYYQSSTNQGQKWSAPLKVDIPNTDDAYCAFSRGNCFLGDYNQLATGGQFTYIVHEDSYASFPGEPVNNSGGSFSGCPTNPNGINGFSCHTHQYTWVAVIGPGQNGPKIAEAPLVGGLTLAGAAAIGLTVALRRRRRRVQPIS